jgi:hypothetical protein
MRRFFKFFLKLFLIKLFLMALLLVWLVQKPAPDEYVYGISFNTMYARELGLDWREVYDAFIDDLGVRRLRLAAHWPMVEPERGVYNFSELDYQIERAESAGADVILAIGRRLPRWPECHVPAWAQRLSSEDRNMAQLRYMTKVIERYRERPVVISWQVENEPFLRAFAFEQCGPLDADFLDQEIDLVRGLDSTRPVLVTDSGNLGTWFGAYRRGDIFGTSVYVYFWSPELGQFKTFLPAWFYRAKTNLMSLRFGQKETLLIELSAEPWLVAPVVDVPINVQFERMNEDKFIEIIDYAKRTRLGQQYLWGGEWWYWLKLQGYPGMWEMGKDLFVKEEPDIDV